MDLSATGGSEVRPLVSDMCRIPPGGPPIDHQNPYANITDEDEGYDQKIGKIMDGEANKIQVGGTHYKNDPLVCPKCGHKMEHWDVSWLWNWDMFQYNVTKYLLRWRSKNGLQDLHKALHHLQKYVEMVAADLVRGGSVARKVSQDQDVTPAAPGGLARDSKS